MRQPDDARHVTSFYVVGTSSILLVKIAWASEACGVFALYPHGVYYLGMDAEIKQKISNRLNRIEGQVRGLKEMVEKEEYCIDVITQSSAIRQALSSVENKMLENHLSEHVIEQMQEGKEDTAIEEIINVFKKAKNK